jgi:uncharacterized protein (DUF433 family)
MAEMQVSVGGPISFLSNQAELFDNGLWANALELKSAIESRLRLARPRVTPIDGLSALVWDGDHAVAFTRVTHNPDVMGGKPCIRGLRVTVGTVVGLLASGQSRERILQAYPYLEPEDIDEALAYAAWRLQEREEALSVA